MQNRKHTFQLRAAVAAVSFLTILAAGCAPSQQPCSAFNIGLAQLKDEAIVGTMPEVDQVMNDFLSKPGDPSPGAAVAIVQNNQIVYLKGYGYADLGQPDVSGDETPFTKDTMSRLGSTSKPLTAIAVMELAKQGYLNLDDTLGAHLPAVPAAWSAITIRELLSHQSGLAHDPYEIADAENWLNATYPWAGPHPGINPRLAYYTYLSTPVLYPPGHAKYSNTGFALLGAVIDNITTQPGFSGHGGFEDFLWWNIGLRGGQLSEPTMTSMCLDTYWRHAAIKDVATGYRKNAMNQLVPEGYPNRSGWEGPPGGWDMTIGDLARLGIAFQTDKLVDAATRLNMTTSAGSIAEDLGKYGLGWFVGDVRNKPVYSHGGDIEGYTARLTVWPNDNLEIALLCNRTYADLRGLEENLAKLFLPSGGFGSRGAPGIQMTEADLRKTKTPEYIVATQHRERIENFLKTYVQQTGSISAAGSLLQARLAVVDPTGALVRALERGDYRTAAAVYLKIYLRIPELSGASLTVR